jgi:hypothetical protein
MASPETAGPARPRNHPNQQLGGPTDMSGPPTEDSLCYSDN